MEKIWASALQQSPVLYVAIETTGIRPEDVPTGISLCTEDAGQPPVFYRFPIDDDKRETAAKFLGEMANLPETPIDTVVSYLISAVEDAAFNGLQLAFVCYNAEFQKRFLSKLHPDLAGVPFIDVSRLNWCLKEAPAVLNEAGSASELESIITSLTYAVKVGGYKALFAEYECPLTSDLTTKVTGLRTILERLSA